MLIKNIGLNITEPEYRALPRYSQSQVCKYAKEGFKCIAHLNDKISSPSLTFGSAVDCLLTGTPEEFKEGFVVNKSINISNSLKQIAQFLFDNYKEPWETYDDGLLSEVAVSLNYYANDKYKNYRIKNIRKEVPPYYELLFKIEGKTILTEEEYLDALNCKNTLCNHPVLSKYFVKPKAKDTHIELVHQLILQGEYDNIPIKGMLDIVYVDHNSKVIYPIDLKTTSKNEYDFCYSFLQWNYQCQAEMYVYLLKQNIEKYPELRYYTIAEFQFLPINRRTLQPMLWLYNPNLMLDPKYKSIDWKKALKELHCIVSTNRQVPLDCSLEHSNNIVECLNNRLYE